MRRERDGGGRKEGRGEEKEEGKGEKEVVIITQLSQMTFKAVYGT